jgi:hypothetical protein
LQKSVEFEKKLTVKLFLTVYETQDGDQDGRLLIENIYNLACIQNKDMTFYSKIGFW